MILKAKILLVDDEEDFRSILSKRLGARGLTVTAVGSGQEALTALKAEMFDIVLLDVKMPDMDGIETLTLIKEIDPLPEVIILTGHASVDAAVALMKCGCYEYLLKPCPMDELIERVEAAYDRKVAKNTCTTCKKEVGI